MMDALDFIPNEKGEYCFEDGVYFNLPEKIYHKDNALGSTSIKDLARNPYRWQYDRIRPRQKMETEAMTWGSAWHCRVLEGKEAFDLRYAKPPKPDDVPGCLVTTEHVKEFLRMHGQKLTGTKGDMIARAKDLDECPPIYDEVLAKWREEHPDYVELTERQVQEIEDAVTNMEADETLRNVMRAGSLIEGSAELSIFWTVGGVRKKARFDYSLAPTAGRPKALVVDLKSFTTFRSGTDEEAAADKVYLECYDLQAAHYMDAYDAARELVAQGKMFGTAPRQGYLNEFLNAPGVDWVWVMLRRDSGMLPVTLSIDTEDQFFKKARDIVADTIDVYRTHVEMFGVDKLWRPAQRLPRRLNWSVMPTYNRGVRYEQPNDR
ncbi:PD-(D/E)XK nuclease-like domain-containing protein [Brucella sp. TWI432]